MTDIDEAAAPLTIHVTGANVLEIAINALLCNYPGIQVVNEDAQVVLIIGAYGQDKLRRCRLRGSSRRRREHYVLISSTHTIDFDLVREVPIDVLIGPDEPLETLIQGLQIAAKGQAYCSPQLVPALIAAAGAPRHNLGASNRHSEDVGHVGVAIAHHGAEMSSMDRATTQAQDSEEHRRLIHLARERGLTQLEAEIAILATEGLQNSDITDRLHLTLPTVKFHMFRAFRKLGISRRSQLIAALSPSLAES